MCASVGARRRKLRFAGATLALPAAAQPTNARVTLIVPASAGGSTDVIARVLGEHMARTLDRIVVIENVSGGATTVASARTAASAPDGTTVLIAQLPLLAAPFLFTGLAYDTQTAFAPVGLINAGYTVLMARKRLASSPAEAVDWLRANGSLGQYRQWRDRQQRAFLRVAPGTGARHPPGLRRLSRRRPGDERPGRRHAGSRLRPVDERRPAGAGRRRAGDPGRRARHGSPASRKCRPRPNWACPTSPWRCGTGCMSRAPRLAPSSNA